MPLSTTRLKSLPAPFWPALPEPKKTLPAAPHFVFLAPRASPLCFVFWPHPPQALYALRVPSIPRPLLTRLVVVVDCDLGSLQELSLQHPVDPEAQHRVFFVGELEEGCTV